MDNNKLYTGQSMDEMVFETRNKAYGAYTLRGEYHKHLLKALALSCSIFIFGLYSPKMVKSLGLFADKPEETLDTTTIVLAQPPSLKDEPPPPPPPPVQELPPPTIKFNEVESTEDPESWIVLAACLGANQRDLEALPLIEKALEARPNYAEAFANRALA